ncbi:hypothetical protein Mal64_09150 [Pseudobythopirellula maris]|uniref:Nucleotidyl transferase AbiEii toxin, Type IV TA system n=1 Tax=Pseudobythopirellula maris TaxID=2527991 RepID=A0A5C5ZSK8_9BACT|nr:nucleotidyl transferase AbiEii/AbiGii toxin family protein [Pseudobythopirellula maris]TWT90524.1 hypothetical protein Mal64_09150 [Pseudobythopirellula maris]
MEQLQFFNDVKRKVIVAILGDDDLADQLVLKGGNLLQFAYEISYRASKDVDISVDGDFTDTESIGKKINQCLSKAFKADGYVLLDFRFSKKPSRISADLEDFWGGYACEFKLVEEEKYAKSADSPELLRRSATPVNYNGSPVFKVDFSRHEFCEDKEEFVIDGYTVNGYSPRMFVAEKIRAICQQMPEYAPVVHRTRDPASRARDFVDIHVIVSHYGVDFSSSGFHDIIRRTFEQKKVPLSLIGRIGEHREAHETSFASVKDTVSPTYDLQDFDFYFDWLCNECEVLEPLWDE